MTPSRAIAVATGLIVMLGAVPALAGKQVYVYSILHPFYGEIGTLTDTIDRGPDELRIDSRLRIAVEVLGVVGYRQESDTTEIMRGDRLISLLCVTWKDGQQLELRGEAQGDRFVVNGTTGSFSGPATTAPSDPWILKDIGDGTLVYPVTGTIARAVVSGGDNEVILVNGASVSVRHFIVMGANREDVWLDNRGIPVMFRTIEDGTAIDFILRDPAVAGATPVASLEPRALPQSAGSDK
jgi:hypothetical protein